MFGRGPYGFIVGALVGAWPFWLVALVRSGERWPGRVGFAIALVLSATAFRTPGTWALGAAAGAVLSWAALGGLVGTDWRLLPYVVMGAGTYYLASAGALGVGILVSMRRSLTGSGPSAVRRNGP